jgi:hypothetical protein
MLNLNSQNRSQPVAHQFYLRIDHAQKIELNTLRLQACNRPGGAV